MYTGSVNHSRPKRAVFYCPKGGDDVTPKQKKFCVEYLIDLNGTQAAIRAGYSKKTANRIANQLLSKLDIRNYIKDLRAKYFKKEIMTAEEVEYRLSKAGRGELKEEVIVVEGVGDGCSEARIVQKYLSVRDQLKALELMGKRHDLFGADTKIEMVPVIITGESDIHE